MGRLLFGDVRDDDLMSRRHTTHRIWWDMLSSMTRRFLEQDPSPEIGPLVLLGRDTMWIGTIGDACAARYRQECL